MRLVSTWVASRLVPSGARKEMSNSDWSSVGVKAFLTVMKSGMLDSSTRIARPLMITRCLIDHSRSRV